jgi:hypothetical protein
VSIDPSAARACFGRGGGEPYDHALRTGGALHLHEDGSAGGASAASRPVEVRRFLAGADRAERRLLASTRGSVFDPVPGAGRWDVVLLLDGNIGIGGDPGVLLSRCREVASPTSVAVVGTSPDRHHHRRYTARVSSSGGRGSDAFPWAEVGADALRPAASEAGWRPVREVHRRRRTFVVLAARAAA